MRALLLLVVPALLAGCGSSGSGGTTLTVFAASSLKGTFTQLGKDFEADHLRVDVVLSFAGSSDLAAQVQQGAAAHCRQLVDDMPRLAVACRAEVREVGILVYELAIEPRAADVLWKALRSQGPALVRSAGVPIVVRRTDTEDTTVLVPGRNPVELSGPVSEVVMYLHGRDEVREIAFAGPAERVAKLRRSSLGSF